LGAASPRSVLLSYVRRFDALSAGCRHERACPLHDLAELVHVKLYDQAADGAAVERLTRCHVFSAIKPDTAGPKRKTTP
jgi:hypothetical protein